MKGLMTLPTGNYTEINQEIYFRLSEMSWSTKEKAWWFTAFHRSIAFWETLATPIITSLPIKSWNFKKSDLRTTAKSTKNWTPSACTNSNSQTIYTKVNLKAKSFKLKQNNRGKGPKIWGVTREKVQSGLKRSCLSRECPMQNSLKMKSRVKR